MNNKFDINKDDLWNKIIQDERMPKNDPPAKRGIWKYLVLLCFFIFIFSLILVDNGSQSEYIKMEEDVALQGNEPSIEDRYHMVQKKDAEPGSESKVDHPSSANSSDDRHVILLTDHSIRNESLHTAQDVSRKIKEREDQTAEVRTDMDLIENRFSQEDLIKLHPRVDDSTNKGVVSSSTSDAHPVLRINEITKRRAADGARSRSITSDGGSDSRVHSGYEDPDKKSLSSEGENKVDFNKNKEIIVWDHLDDDFIQLNVLNKVFNKEVFSLRNTPSIPNKSEVRILPMTKQSRSFYLNMNYGTAFRNLSDSLGNELPESETLESTLNAYQIELGIQKSYGPWRIRAGFGADLQVGRGMWTQRDTIYNQLDIRSTFERIEESTMKMRYQRYGNVFITAGLGYELHMGGWTIVPDAGMKYNLFNMSNGTLLDDHTFEEINLSRSDDRDRYALTLGLSLERHLTNNFSLSVGARHESPISYRLFNGIQHSITPFYFNVGGTIRF